MKLPQPRDGDELRVRDRPVSFGYWPTKRGTAREGLQWLLFSTDPWMLIRSAVSDIPDTTAALQAAAFLRQAQDFYGAALNSDVSAAKPLLLYYCFLNLAKAFVVKKTGAAITGKVGHKLSERLPTTAGAIHGSIGLQTNDRNSAFVQFASALGETLPPPISPKQTVDMRSQDFMSQILIGHRVWCQADGINERFVSLQDISYRDDGKENLWLRVRIFQDDLRRHGYLQKDVIGALGRGSTWRSVACDDQISERRLVEAENDRSFCLPQPSFGGFRCHQFSSSSGLSEERHSLSSISKILLIFSVSSANCVKSSTHYLHHMLLFRINHKV